MKRPSSHEIDVQACQWAARLDRGSLTDSEQLALDLWLDSDIRCPGAFARARGIALYTDRAQALGPDFNPDRMIDDASMPMVPFQSPSRSSAWEGIAFAACLVGLALIVGVLIQLRDTLDDTFETRIGEIRVVSLSDGSVITLNTDSMAIVNYSKESRNVQLVRGEALFEVARNPDHPFEVHAGDTRVRVIGTSFRVLRTRHSPVEILVSTGEVDVMSSPQEAIPVRVSANMKLKASPDSMPEALAPSEIHRKLAWREGRIAFEGETLGQAAEEFARYSDTRIVFAEPAIAEERISGLFYANDPIGFARAVATSLDLRIEYDAGEVQLRR